MIGTEETTAKYAEKAAARLAKGEKPIQTMKSSGISSTDTSRIGNKVLGKAVTGEQAMAAAGKAGVIGGVLSAGMTLASMALDDEYHAADEIAEETLKSGAGGVISGAGGVFAAEAATEVAASVVGGSVAPLVIGVAAAAGTADCLATFSKPILDGIGDAMKYQDITCIGDGISQGAEDVIDKLGDTCCGAIDVASNVTNAVLDCAFDFLGSIVSIFQ